MSRFNPSSNKDLLKLSYYVPLENFPVVLPESNDQPRLQRFANYLESTKKTGFVKNGEYIVNSSWLLGNDVSILMDVNAVIVRNFSGEGSSVATIRNKNLSNTNRNKNIWLTGGKIKAADSSKVGKHLVFWGVDRVKLFDLTINEVYGDWATLFRDCTDVFGLNLEIDTINGDIFTDGIHITGGKRYIFSNCIIKSGDDCISLTVETPEDTNIDGVDIINCNLTTRRSSVIKMTTKTGTSATIKNVKISQITGKGGVLDLGEGVVIKDEDNAGRISGIKLNDVVVDCSQGAGVGFRLQGVKDVKGNMDIKEPQGKGADISYSSDFKLKVRVDSPRTAGVSGISLGNVDDFELEPEVLNATLHGVAVGGAGAPVTNGKIINGKTKNSTNTGVRLINAVGVDVVNHRSIGDANGIIEDSGSDYNHIKNNDVRTVSGTKVSIVGTNSKVRENKGYTTENRIGSTVLASGATSVTVTHGLSTTPSLSGIKPTFQSAWSGFGEWWISDINPTTFKFNVKTAPTANVTLGFDVNAPKNI